MTATLFFSMAAFALAASISPGPVNIVSLGAGAQFGFGPALRHVFGATSAFTLLLIAIGLGLLEVIAQLPGALAVVKWAGVAFLLYMAVKLALDNGELGQGEKARRPSIMTGALMQWLNPKAWLASLAGMGAYAANGGTGLVLQFAALYFVICLFSIACWAGAGAFLGRFLTNPKRMRIFNRILAVLLIASAAYLVIH